MAGMEKKNVYWGIFLIALATLTWQVLLTRIFSATMYYHFVFMSISLAMLGFGCSGVMVFLFPHFFSYERCDRHLCIFSLIFAVTMILAIVVYLRVALPAQISLAAFTALVKIFLFIFIPYLFSGLTVTLALKHYARYVNKLYCYDLVGAGLGCILVIAMLFMWDGLSLVVLTAFIAAAASIVFARSVGSSIVPHVSTLIAMLLLLGFVVNAGSLRFLRVTSVAGISQDDIIFEKWNPINRVTVTPQNFMDTHKSLRINYDSAALAHMHYFDGDPGTVNYLQNTIQSFYYQVRKNADVLVIGVGGGQDVLNAYVNGHTNIIGIEINPTIAKLNIDIYRDFNNGLFHYPGIRLVVDEGRNFVRHTSDRFDIIHLPNVDSGVASSSGAFTFVENSLYTVEAFMDYYDRLKEDGVLWIARWRSAAKSYYMENFRVMTGMVSALAQLGIAEPGRHIVMLEEPEKQMWRQAITLMKKQPFTAEEIEAIDEHRQKIGLQWLLRPGQKLNNALSDYLCSSDRKAFLAAYPLNVSPGTDDRPFFFNFLKPLHYVWKSPPVQTHFTYPVFMFKSLFIIVSLMVLITIFLPMLFFRRVTAEGNSVRFRGGYVLYFICLGLGFMMVEIPLIQKFILFLGQPLYAIAAILSTLLIFSGLGSLLAGRFSDQAALSGLRGGLALLCVFLVASTLGLSSIFNLGLGMHVLVRLGIAALVILPLGLLMGMALPLGIRQLERDGASMIPWVWAVNGACSVMGSIMAWGLSLNFGYNATILVAAAMYGCACLTMILKPSAR